MNQTTQGSKPIIIGIAGGTGAGKSTLINSNKSTFQNEIAILSHDFYYRSHDDLSYEERAALNYDHPDAFETDLMIQQIRDLREGIPVQRPVYDFVIHNRTKETIRVMPARVIIVEGILLFEHKGLLAEFDIKVFVDTDADVRIIRRIQRDVRERGRSMESVIEQYLTTVKPMHEAFVEPSRKHADLIIPEGGYNLVALEMLQHRIKSLL